MKRHITPFIIEDLSEKIILISGPRQVGKTTISKRLRPDYTYLNYDRIRDREIMRKEEWDRKKPLLILDEIHKMTDWKQWLKGIYDTEGLNPNIVVTGSAKLDTYKRMGDSLAGRFFSYHLYPLDVKECCQFSHPPQDAFEQIWNFSGFPEPFLKQKTSFYKKWQHSHLDSILRQDLMDTTNIQDIKSVELLVERLRHCVGSPVSFLSLARDLNRDPKTIKRWINELENTYVLFSVFPYSKNIARSLQKQGKYYFYDIGRVDSEAAKLENLVALSLKKELARRTDCEGDTNRLTYVRTTDKKEIDFAIEQNGQITQLIEVKWKDGNFSSALKKFRPFFPTQRFTQLVLHLDREKTSNDNAEIRSLVPWLSQIPLEN